MKDLIMLQSLFVQKMTSIPHRQGWLQTRVVMLATILFKLYESYSNNIKCFNWLLARLWKFHQGKKPQKESFTFASKVLVNTNNSYINMEAKF